MIKTRSSFSTFRETGYLCIICNIHTKGYNGVVPQKCPSCGSDHLKKEWDQNVSILSRVEEIKDA